MLVLACSFGKPFERLRALFIPLLAGLLCLGSAGSVLSDRMPEVSGQSDSPSFQKGLSFATWWSGQYLEPCSDVSLELLADTGTEWISLIVTAY